jgi:cytochrome c556
METQRMQKQQGRHWIGLSLIAMTIGFSVPALAEAPQTLKQIMMHLGKDMAAISDAIWTEDYATIAAASHRVGGHAEVSPEQRQQIFQKLGKDMGQFKAFDAAVHDAAHAMAEAADKRDMTAVLQQYGKIQQSCVACHGTFRSRLTSAP